MATPIETEATEKPEAQREDAPPAPERILVVRLGAIGDVLMLLPAVHALNERGARIDWLCGKSVSPLLELYPWIQRIVVDDVALYRGGTAARTVAMTKLWARLAARKYDFVATIQYDERYKLLTRTARVKRRLSLVHGWREREILEGRPHAAEYARILGLEEDGFRTKNWRPLRPDKVPALAGMQARPAGLKGRIAIVPAGAKNVLRESSLRRWPVENYITLTRTLLSHGYQVVLTGNSDDAWVRDHFRGLAVEDWIGRTTLTELLALYDVCDAVVTHDTGCMHVAGISHAAIVALFGPTDPGNFLPRRHGVVGLWGGARLPCRPCYDGRDFAPCSRNGCMEDISPERVLEALDWLLAHRRNRTDQDFCWHPVATSASHPGN